LFYSFRGIGLRDGRVEFGVQLDRRGHGVGVGDEILRQHYLLSRQPVLSRKSIVLRQRPRYWSVGIWPTAERNHPSLCYQIVYYLISVGIGRSRRNSGGYLGVDGGFVVHSVQRVFAGTTEYSSSVKGTVFVIHQILSDCLLEYSSNAVVKPASLERFVYFRNELRRRLLASFQRV